METPIAADQYLSRALARTALALAERFSRGATMWCVAPAWPSHGRHVAVEFVHPVIVGTRALPAVSLPSERLVSTVRSLARPGDILLCVGPFGDPQTAGELLVRAEAWGLQRIWLGAGPRPATERVDHLIWLDQSDPERAARAGEVVLLYHLLWELTQVALEHPGLLGTDPGEPPATLPSCPACADQALTAEVRAVRSPAEVEAVVSGATQIVDASLVEAVVPGDLVLVHAGVALGRMDLGEAASVETRA